MAFALRFKNFIESFMMAEIFLTSTRGIKMKLLGLTSFLLLSQIALATTSENVIVIERPKAVYQDSSEYNRMNKQYLLSLQAFGINPTGMAGGGLTAGMYLDRNSILFAEVTNNANQSTFFGSDYNIKGTSVGVHYKRFVGNSFYVRAGADYRTVDYKYKYSSFVSSNFDSESSFIGESLAASLVIGNQWQWENFTLGCDWIGVTAPFSSKIKEDRFGGATDSYDRSRQERDKKHFVTDTIAQGLRLYLGASF